MAKAGTGLFGTRIDSLEHRVSRIMSAYYAAKRPGAFANDRPLAPSGEPNSIEGDRLLDLTGPSSSTLRIGESSSPSRAASSVLCPRDLDRALRSICSISPSSDCISATGSIVANESVECDNSRSSMMGEAAAID